MSTSLEKRSKPTTTLLLLAVLLLAMMAPSFAQAQSPGQSKRIVPVELELRLAHTEPAEGLVVSVGEEETLFLGPIELTTRHIESLALVDERLSVAGSAQVIEVVFTRDGADLMRALSRKHLGERLAVLVGGRLLAAPTIRSELADRVLVQGSGTLTELLGRGLGLE